MLPSSQRLSRQQVTDLLLQPQLKVVFNRAGTLKYVVSTSNALTVVTGSKQQKRAVLRNKARRRIYSAFQSYAHSKAITGILYISKQVYEMPYQELQDTIYALLSKTAKNS